MSWVQSLQQSQHQQQQQQSPPPLDSSNIYATSVPITAPNSYLVKSCVATPLHASITLNTKNNHNVMHSQLHVNGGNVSYAGAATSASPQQHQQQQSQQSTNSHFNVQQPSSWQQQNYFQPSKVMQPAVVGNWPQQQQHQPPQPSMSNASNMYQQHASAANNINNWQRLDLQTSPSQPQQYQQQQILQPAAPTYDNYYASTAAQQQHQQPQPPHYPQQHDAAVYFVPTQQQPTNDFYNNSNINNKNSDNKSDGWGDWDWNDNSNAGGNELEQQKQTQQQPPQQQQSFNANVVEESFNSKDNSWYWSATDTANANANEVDAAAEKLSASVAAAYVAPTQLPGNNNEQQQQSRHQQANSVQVPQQQKATELSFATPKSANTAAKPTSLSLSEFTNDNCNNASLTAATNIPSSVYVSQAKPVSRPSRQYASPPGGATPAETPESSALTPPQAFQNEPHKVEATVTDLTAPLSAAVQPPPPAITAPTNMSGPPPPTIIGAAGDNPFKRAGAAQHHHAGLLSTTATSMVTTAAATSLPMSTVFDVPPPPADFANPIMPNHLEPDNSEILHENQEVLGLAQPDVHTISLVNSSSARGTLHPLPPPNDERNQYLQTSHLSENPDEEFNAEADSLPPPGLSRLVLGQPELEASQRMVTGTEEPAHMHLAERQADGEDTSLEQLLTAAVQRGAASNSVNLGAPASSTINTIDITTDRNLYLVPGESNTGNEQRVVTGVEMNIETSVSSAAQIIVEQREIELDGENLEDQHVITVTSRNEPPLEGAAASAEVPTPVAGADQTEEHHHHHQAKSKDHSNVSTGNDESDPVAEVHHHHHGNNNNRYANKSRKHLSDADRKQPGKHRRDKQRSSADRYNSEEEQLASEEYSSDRERRRCFREGSVRSDRERNEREYAKEKRRRDHAKRDAGAADRTERENQRDKYYQRGGEGGSKSERRGNRYSRYEEPEESSSQRHNESRRGKEQTRRVGGPPADDRSGRSDRSDRDYDDYNRRHRGSKRDKADDGREGRRGTYAGEERREQRRLLRERDDFDTIERRRRSDKQRERGEREYEEYRKQSSRNARESDVEKERARASTTTDPRYDPRHAGMYGYPPATYGYDPYAYYYEQMARTNPQAYSEWCKKYYGQVAAGAVAGSLSGHAAAGDHASLNSISNAAATGDGRESVHSGRSSAHNDKERYTHAYISQANEYHRHFQREQQQHQHQHQMAYNMSLNSTRLDEGNGSVYGVEHYSLRAARSTSNLSQIHGAAATYYRGADRVFYARSEYAESRSGNMSLRDVDAIAEPDSQRLTPRKFVNEHTVASLSAGLLVTVKPKYTARGTANNVVKIQRLSNNDATRQLMQAFPGPLVRGLTHKKTIIEFCADQIRLGPMQTTVYAKPLQPNNMEKYRASYTLMWNLLILLLRQNGMVVGTDIAELLLKNQQQFPYQAQIQAVASRSTDALECSDEGDAQTSDTEVNHEANVAEEAETEVNVMNSPTITETEITEKFRNYLLYGNVNEALEWATDNNLWGHALFLASKVDRRSHANVMMKFANKLSLNDPLQTLYQLMSGRQPSSVTSVQDEKWGDWRPHLSMILSNTSQKPELDRKAITTLGDSLFNRGDLFAAHFCYLMAQVGFGRYQESATQETTLQQYLPKLVLLGSSHYKSLHDFATNEAIIMTEIYEYACSLNDDKFSIVEFQPYKYLLAARLLDYGYNLRSLMYMEQLALHIQREPSKYEPTLINKIYDFADRLKYYDPVLEKTMDDQQQNVDGSLNNALPSFEEQKWLQDLRTIVAQQQLGCHKPAPTEYHQSTDAHASYIQSQIDEQFMEINKQFNELNMQYSPGSNMEPVLYNPDTMQQQQQQQSQQLHFNNDEHYNHQPQQTSHLSPLSTATATDFSNQQHYMQPEQQPALTVDAALKTTDATNPYANYVQNYLQPEQQQNTYYDSAQHQQEFNQAESLDAQNANASYDYWGAQQQLQSHYGDENSRPTISLPKSKSYESEDEKQRQQQSQNNTDNQAKKNAQQKLKVKSDSGKEANKGPQSNQNSGWFGGIWNKLSLKPKNQMILPDDKNPAIVWDPEKKRWVNTDGEEAAPESLKPPPKMSDIMPQAPPQLQHQQQEMHLHRHQQQQQQHLQPLLKQMPPIQQPEQHLQQAPSMDTQQYGVSSMQSAMPTVASSAPGASASNYTASAATPVDGAIANKTPSLQSNMFKMQRNRTLKNSYVDVFNPSGAPMSKAAENVLAPALPPAAVPQGGFFIPGAESAGSDNDGATAYHQQQHQQLPQQQDVPQYYNPNQFAGGAGGAMY